MFKPDHIIKIEEAFLFGISIYVFIMLPYDWWWFLALILVPDIGMLGYLYNKKAGAILYNIFHHKGIAIALFFLGIYLYNDVLQLAGAIMFGHASLDRVFGYGLKYEDDFKHTHLGNLK